MNRLCIAYLHLWLQKKSTYFRTVEWRLQQRQSAAQAAAKADAADASVRNASHTVPRASADVDTSRSMSKQSSIQVRVLETMSMGQHLMDVRQQCM